MEYLDHPVPRIISSKSDSTPPLVGSALPSATWMGQLHTGFSTQGGFLLLAKGAFKLQRGRSAAQGARSKRPLTEVSVCVATTHHTSSMIASGPTVH